MTESTCFCPYCGQRHEVVSDTVGKEIECVSCKRTFAVPEPKVVPQDSGNMVKKCPFCAEEIKSEAIKCKHCGSILNSQSPVSPRPEPKKIDVMPAILAQDKFEMISGETLLMDGMATYIKSAINCIPSQAYLTNYRLVICSKNMVGAGALFGPIGGAVALARKPTKITAQIPIAAITSITMGKHGFAAKYTVTTRMGERYDMQFNKVDEWRSAFGTLGVAWV